jgi:mannose-6-phosphate isomerase-like protein (cupin superfamily)
MFQLLKIEQHLTQALAEMFAELGEPAQALGPDSPHPLVVHGVMGQLTLVVSGTGFASLAGETFAIEPGDLIVMEPGCQHSFYCPVDELVLRHWHWPQALLDTDRVIITEAFDFRAASRPGGWDGGEL